MGVEVSKNAIVNASADQPPATPVDTLRLEGATVLAVWAHPDDESYLGGGLMATAAAAGGRVVNVTATLGEHGTPDPLTCRRVSWLGYDNTSSTTPCERLA